MNKINTAIEKIRKAERLALEYQDYGFYLAFSGGKDSQVVYELCKMAGVKFRAYYNVTTIDYPEVVRFIREYYPDVVFLRPKMNFYKLIIKYKSLPMINRRYCCKELKEYSGKNAVVLTGIRRAESNKRAKRNELELYGHKYSDTLDQFNIDKEKQIVCVNGNDKILFSPIINWEDKDVWNFLRTKKMKYCQLYDEGYRRVGCIFCPFSPVKVKQRDRKKYPKIEKLIKRSIAELVKKGKYAEFNGDVDEIFEWWISNKTVEQYKASKLNYKIEF